MIRVVLDTNVVVSALLNSEGSEALVFRLALHATSFQLCVSDPVLTEYRGVLIRPKFKRSPRVVAQLLAEIHKLAERVEPMKTVSASPDDADNRFLECAETANADYLVTGNPRHFPSAWGKTRVVNARQFIEAVMPRP